MEKQIEYNGYEIIETHNKKIVAQIKNNLHVCEQRGQMRNMLMHEPPIKFVFTNYDTMINFINENKR